MDALEYLRQENEALRKEVDYLKDIITKYAELSDATHQLTELVFSVPKEENKPHTEPEEKDANEDPGEVSNAED